MLVTDNIRRRPLHQTGLLSDKCICAVVHCGESARPYRTEYLDLGFAYRQVLQADGLRITLPQWIHLGKVVGLVLVTSGKLSQPYGLASQDALRSLSSPDLLPASAPNAVRLAKLGWLARPSLEGSDGPLLPRT